MEVADGKRERSFHAGFSFQRPPGQMNRVRNKLRQSVSIVWVMMAAVLAGCGAVWWFRDYEGRVEVERERLRHEIVVLGMAREKQSAAVHSAEVRARNARALLEQERTLEQEKRVREANELLVRARAEWEAIHDEEIRDYEKLSGRDRLLGSDW